MRVTGATTGRHFAAKIPSVLEAVRELESGPIPIIALGREYPAGHLVERHHHGRAQLIYASAGVMRIDTSRGVWVVPPQRAVWVPPAMDHEIRATSAVLLRTLYIRPGLKPWLPQKCCVIEVSLLLRELILRMVSIEHGAQYAHTMPLLAELVLEEISRFEALPLNISMPSSPRVLKICQQILDDPADSRTCADWGREVGASSRTLERLFLKETGMSFGSWRRQARLLDALRLLASGTPVMNVAFDLGYESPSAFAAMFKRSLGRTPSDYFA